jgi:hypothetical protein
MRYSQLLENVSARWFHRTTSDRVDSILQHGLKVGSEINLTLGGDWSFEVYGQRPVFLSKSPDMFYKEHAPILLEVDTTGIELVADLPSLVDAGAYYDLDEWCMWFKGSDAELSFDDLLNPYADECKEVIRRTGTAACLTDIPPNHIRVINGHTA